MKDRRTGQRQTKDRRNNYRVHAKLSISASVNDESIDIKMQNLSHKGFQVIEPSPYQLSAQQSYCILIEDENSQKIELDAHVVWKRCGFVGFSFTDINNQIEPQLNQLLNKLLMQSIAVNGMSALG